MLTLLPPGPTRTLSTSALVCLLALGAGACSAEPTEPPAARSVAPAPSPSKPPPEITLGFAGDVHFAGRTAALLDNPDTAFGSIASELSATDVTVVNLETAVTEGGTPEPKQFHFRTPATAYQAVKAAGVDAVSLANNHALDYGRAGLADTLRHAEDSGVAAFGAGEDADAAYAPWVKEVEGVRIGFVGLSQISELSSRWAPGKDRSGVAMGHNLKRAARAVEDAKAAADVVIVYLHWGAEGNECPTGRMKRLAKALADAGATAVIGTHSHLLLGDGWLGDTYVAYGLGNFLWWRDNAYSNDTGVLRLTLHGPELVGSEFRPARITGTGQPVIAEGQQAERISKKFAGLRDCTGLAGSP